MPTTRSYGDACALARALDVVGERWALLVARELLFGPQRFSDLRRALPKASSNVLADRLRELMDRGVIRHRRLAPPAGSSVYELTDWGRALEPILLALGEWGSRVELPPNPTLSATSVMLFLRGVIDPDLTSSTTVYGFALDDRMWTVRTIDGRLDVQSGEPLGADVVVRTDATTLNALLSEPQMLDNALAEGRIVVEGNVAAIHTLFEAARVASPA